MNLRLRARRCDNMRKTKKETLNLWELKPLRLREWEKTDDGKVTILIPKFKNELLKKWLLPKLAKPFFRVKLDKIGSTIWLLIDGDKTVAEIADNLRKIYGESVEPLEERLGKFLQKMERGDLIKVDNKMK